MNTPKSNATDRAQRRETGRADADADQATPETDLQPEDTGTAASGAANRGSPAAPVMKQFQKTDSETGGSASVKAGGAAVTVARWI